MSPMLSALLTTGMTSQDISLNTDPVKQGRERELKKLGERNPYERAARGEAKENPEGNS